jgi:small subunit ribosomal protein S1
MFSDHDHPVTAAAAAPAHESQSPASQETPQASSHATSQENQAEQQQVAAQKQAAPAQANAESNAAHETPSQRTEEDPKAETSSATAPETPAAVAQPEAAEVHGQHHERAEASAAQSATDAEAAAAAEEAASTEEMSKLLDQYDEQHESPANNEIIEVKVIAYTEHGVVVDIGQKMEGLIPAAEFSETEIPRPDPNATIEVQRTGEKKDGYVIVSYQKVLRRRTWERLDEAYKNKTTLTGKVVDRIKGGVVVDVGVRAFLPGSQYDLRPTPNLDALAGQELQVRITKLNRRRGNVVVSRRAILEEEQHAKRGELMNTLAEGQTVHGVVKNVTEYGAFVDLGGIDGLLHLTDLSWGRIKHPSDVVKPDQELDVIILKFDKEKQRVSLGLKQLSPDPWVNAAEKYPAGGKFKGKVVGVVDYGAFVELETGIEGLVHATEMSWAKKSVNPAKIVKVGEEVDVVVLDIKPSDRRVSLGMKQAQPDPWLLTADKYPVGTIVTGKVRNIVEFGAFIEIEDGFDGLVHVSDVSWTERIKNPHEVFKKGEPVTAKVLRIDEDNRRVSLGMKQVKDIWGDWFKQHRVGEIVKGKVSRIAMFGAFVELGENIEGLCHNTEITDRRRGDDGSGMNRTTTGPLKSAGPLEPGKEYDFKIIKISPESRKIALSYKAAVKQVERQEIAQYRSTSKTSSTATIGDVLKQKLSSR